jgi:probable rRNA maturation factor
MGRVLAELGRRGVGLSILFSDDEGLRDLNRRFRGVDKPTNVLAFPDTVDAIGLPNHLGDVALSIPTLRREAAEAGEDLGDRLYFYLIHAVLHLVGHDHELGPAAERAQHEETRRLLALIRRDL